ncbi:hypothetical protein [Hydrogenophaga sp. 5NK40-0174]|uniref:hypothetical protein n=1 Tax=Hydrogenophaga sp. 5NK40-0174 TaxID=3127649 RepID=UPI003108F070
MNKVYSIAAISLSLLMPLQGVAQQPLSPESEIRGRVEQWAPGVGQVKVNGQTYRMSKSVQVIDKKAAPLPRHAVRAGSRVSIVVSDNVVTHVVVNPGEEPTLDESHK